MKNPENAKIIWQVLRANGATEAGAAGCLGNISGESSYVAYRVQGDMDPDSGYAFSKEYTKKVDSGKISKSEFCYEGPYGGGYGLCQWTHWSRKSNLYNYLKAQDMSIGDLVGQAKFLVKELKERYPAVWNVIITTNDIRAAMYEVLTEYERPANQGKDAQDKRYNAGKECFDAFRGLAIDKRDEYLVNKDFNVLSSGSNGADVYSLQAALLQKGYNPNGVDGIFGQGTEGAVRAYQKDKGYTINGIVNEKLFNEIIGIETPKPPVEEPKIEEEKTPEKETPLNNSITVKTIQLNDQGVVVKNLQLLLNGKGYSVGYADGIFGNNTLKGLKKFQKAKGIDVDGICGLATWSVLINE